MEWNLFWTLVWQIVLAWAILFIPLFTVTSVLQMLIPGAGGFIRSRKGEPGPPGPIGAKGDQGDRGLHAWERQD